MKLNHSAVIWIAKEFSKPRELKVQWLHDLFEDSQQAGETWELKAGKGEGGTFRLQGVEPEEVSDSVLRRELTGGI